MNTSLVRNSVLLRYWLEPEKIATFSVPEWELFFRQARACRLAAQWAYKIALHEEFDYLPEPVQLAFEAAWTTAEHHQRAVSWEAKQIARFLAPLPCKKILLKGAAYMATDLEFAQGRLISDLDILVPKNSINPAEEILLKNGWVTGKYNPYDQRYYREWMHELPPLLNVQRNMTLDMHHNILPETSRRRVDIEPLLEVAVPVVDLDDASPITQKPDKPAPAASDSTFSDPSNFVAADPESADPVPADADSSEGDASRSEFSDWYVFQDVDMTIHSAVHMFQEGEVYGSLRDIVDIDGLIRNYSQSSDSFQGRLIDRAVELKLERPVFYAIRYAHEFLDTPLEDETAARLRRIAPGPFTRTVMDRLVVKSLAPPLFEFPSYSTSLARLILYIRSHYGRMPLKLLIPHLWHKTFPQDELPTPDNDGQDM